MSSRSDDLLGILMIAGAVYLGVTHFGRSDYVTVYRAYCAADKPEFRLVKVVDCSSVKDAYWQPYYLKYRINYAAQKVHLLGLLQERYDDCKVADLGNWSCLTNGNERLGMSDGYFSSSDETAKNIAYIEYLRLDWLPDHHR